MVKYFMKGTHEILNMNLMRLVLIMLCLDVLLGHIDSLKSKVD
jgi:hypothetical protein